MIVEFLLLLIYVDHIFIFLHVCLLLMTLVMVCCIVGPNGAAKQQDFSYKLMIHGGCRAVANCPLVCPTLTLSVTKMRRKISFFYQRFIFLCPAIQKWSPREPSMKYPEARGPHLGTSFQLLQCQRRILP